MKLLIRNGHLLDPGSGLDAPGDVAIADGRVLALGQIWPSACASPAMSMKACWLLN